jgi:hypothetical protein
MTALFKVINGRVYLYFKLIFTFFVELVIPHTYTDIINV